MGLYISITVINANYYSLLSENKQNEAKNLNEKVNKVFKTLGYITTITNVLSCLILFMTIRHAYKLTQKQENNEDIRRELRINARVTSMHIALIIGSTIGAFLHDRPHVNATTYFRGYTAYLTLTAIQEMFLAYNMFFILDEEKRADIIRDESRQISYALLEVVKPRESR